MEMFTIFILALFFTIVLVPVFKRLAFRMNIVDVPDERKVHLMPMPKTGGISMAIGAFVPMMVWVAKDDFFSSVVAASIIIVVFGLIDDIKPMTAGQKILPQIAAALIVIFYGGVRICFLGDLAPDGYVLPGFLSVPLTLLVILGVTNAINLADGLDGLAGGISMLSFILIVFLAYQSGNMQIALMAVAMVGGIAGFLRYNTHPAILFMGDAGSQLLGFLAVVFSITLAQSNAPYAKILFLTIIGFPILDTLTVMVERIIKKRSPFSADKNHFHHRLLRHGFYHTEAVLTIYIIQSCFIAFALMFRFYSGWVHLIGFMAFSSVILLTFLLAKKRDWALRRGGGFDTVIKRRLKVLKEKNIFIRVCFGGLRYGFPLLLACQVMIPRTIPLYFSVLALCLTFLIGISYYFNIIRIKEHILRISTYVITPLLLYMAENDTGPWMSADLQTANHTGFMVLAFFVISTLNLTRRSKGFKISPLDILVFIVILIFPNLPTLHLEGLSAGTTLAKALVLFFSFDVLIGELRTESGILAKPSMAFLALLALRGFAG